jgi:hypothetical protein
LAGPRRRRGGDRAGCSGLSGVRGTQGAPERAKEGGGEHQCDAWKPARVKTWPGGLSTAPAGGALHSGGENRAKELEEGEKDPNIISEIFRDQTVKQRCCSTFQDLQL